VSVLVIVSLIKMFLGVWNAPASGLAEVALREAVRRQAVTASMRSMTNADIGPAPERPAAKVPADEGPSKMGDKTADAAAVAKPASETVTKDEAWWRARITQARAALDRDKMLFAALENRVSTLTRDVVNRDDPAQRAALAAERIRTMEELELMRKQIAADTEAIAAIEEEARREGVPPGWIRLG